MNLNRNACKLYSGGVELKYSCCNKMFCADWQLITENKTLKSFFCIDNTFYKFFLAYYPLEIKSLICAAT